MTLFDPSQPFVLLDDASPGGTARLFTELRGTVVATTPDAVRPALDALRRASGHRAGFIGFDAGYALEPVLAPLARRGDDGLPMLWFGEFGSMEPVDVETLLGDVRGTVGALVPAIGEAAYAAMVGQVAALIAAGDIYQANLTFAAAVAVSGHPLGIYRRLRAAAAAPFGALVHTGAAWVLSFSPELFFALDAGRLTARPMKGTAARGNTRTADDAAAAALAADPKNRAENLMIVDLLRNDLARVADPGSVAVPALFAVERYPTLLQMTSTIVATTAAAPVDVLAALFPCGSITGAPKIRAMQVVAEVEPGPRGLYTGSIGWLSGMDAVFNVAIRTLVMKTRGTARLGLGAGIVADSEAGAEWHECLAKAGFLQRRRTPDIIETMRCADGIVARLDRHLARAAATAAFLGTRFDADAVRGAVIQATAGATGRVRLLVSPGGAMAVQLSPLPPAPAEPIRVAVASLPVDPADWRLRHKTTDRSFYDAARLAGGVFETIFVRPDGRITEGSFTNVFVARDGRSLTPRAADGLLPGVFRAELLDDGRAIEADLTLDDLGDGFFVGNSLRGLIDARLVQAPDNHPRGGGDPSSAAGDGFPPSRG